MVTKLRSIANKFNYYKFSYLQNPFGILFHPKAIENLILNAINIKEYSQKMHNDTLVNKC